MPNTPRCGVLRSLSTNESSPKEQKPGIRWWPLAILLLLVAARLFQIWVLRDHERQFKFDSTRQLLKYAAPAILLWFLLLSRSRLRTRLVGLLALGAIGTFLFLSLEYRGINGDGQPVLEWKWNTRTDPGTLTITTSNTPPASTQAPAADAFPGFQGPRRDATFPDLRLATDWSTSPPRELWRVPVAEGWAGFAVADGFAVSLEQQGDQETVFALSLTDGRRLWAQSYAARYASADAGNGPRSVPAIVNGRVFTAGATGRIQCRDLRDGRLLWDVDLVTTHRGRIPEWGYSASPLVANGIVWVPAGATNGSLVGLDVRDGSRRHAGGDAGPGYASPIEATIAGTRQILVFNEVGLAGHDAGSGERLWQQPIPYAPHVAAPVVAGTNRVLVSVGYGKGTFAVDVVQDPAGSWTNSVAWKSIRLKSKFANFFATSDSIYGLDDGALVALSAADGALRWKERRFGHGQLLLAGDHLLVCAESGEVFLLSATAAGMKELARHRVFDVKTWNPPALAGNRLILRNDREAACIELPLAAARP